MTTITIKILKTNGHSAPGKLADAEIHFTGGELDGLKLVGFAVWQRRDGHGQNVSFPSRQFTVHGDRRSFSLLRWITDPRPRTGSAIWCCRSFAPHTNRSSERPHRDLRACRVFLVNAQHAPTPIRRLS